MSGILSSSSVAEVCRWCIVVGIAYTLATGVLSFFSSPAAATTSATPALAAGRSQRAERFDLPQVSNRHIFGRAVITADGGSSEPTNEPAKQTKLPLELLGVFVAEAAEDSAAIVAQKKKPGLLFNIGETLPGNATLEEVYGDRIIIKRLGVREELSFADESAGFVADANDDEGVRPLSEVRRRRSGAATAPQGAQTSEAELSNESGGNPVAAQQPRTPREFLEAYGAQLAGDPEGLLAELDVQPVSAGGSDGYRLGNLASSPYLSQTGLQSGDVILSVNGQPIGNVQQDQSRLGALLTQGSARLEVKRGSRRFYVTASLK